MVRSGPEIVDELLTGGGVEITVGTQSNDDGVSKLSFLSDFCNIQCLNYLAGHLGIDDCIFCTVFLEGRSGTWRKTESPMTDKRGLRNVRSSGRGSGLCSSRTGWCF